jgi:hypothetical protein
VKDRNNNLKIWKLVHLTRHSRTSPACSHPLVLLSLGSRFEFEACQVPSAHSLVYIKDDVFTEVHVLSLRKLAEHRVLNPVDVR